MPSDDAAKMKGPAEWFTGDVEIQGLAQGEEPSRVQVAAVHFSPGARTAWHSHAVGQVLYVTEGEGFVQARGEDVITLRVGDVHQAPADQVHWHGATAHHRMTHLSITENLPEGDDRPSTDWGPHVTDDEYPG